MLWWWRGSYDVAAIAWPLVYATAHAVAATLVKSISTRTRRRVPRPALRVVAVDALDRVAAVAVVACVELNFTAPYHRRDVIHTGRDKPHSSRTC